MSRFSCPCGLTADVPADEMLEFISLHDCAYHTATTEPQTAHQAWASWLRVLLYVVLILGVVAICKWGSHP